MKIYYHPASTTSRPLMLFAAESGLKIDFQVVDLFTGEHYQPKYEAINPNHLVPVLEDGDFRLTESSAILKYLADSVNSPLYPKDLKQRARVVRLAEMEQQLWVAKERPAPKRVETRIGHFCHLPGAASGGRLLVDRRR